MTAKNSVSLIEPIKVRAMRLGMIALKSIQKILHSANGLTNPVIEKIQRFVRRCSPGHYRGSRIFYWKRGKSSIKPKNDFSTYRTIPFSLVSFTLKFLINQNLILFGQELRGETSLQNMPDYSFGQKEGIEPISGNRKVITQQRLYQSHHRVITNMAVMLSSLELKSIPAERMKRL